MAAVKHLTTEELAGRLGIEKRTVEDWRADGKGPAYIRVGRARKATIRYRLVDVEAWEEASLVTPVPRHA